MDITSFEAIFNPGSIAIIGASADTHKMGYHYVKSVVRGGYAGRIYPINRDASEIFGLKCYPTLSAVPGSVDLLIVSIPRTAVLDLLDECARKGVRAVHFFTAGFRELGDDLGNTLEKQMVEKARRGGFRIIGPNCLGIYSAPARIPMGPTAMTGAPGPVSFVIQSGGISEKIALVGLARNINFNKGVSYGNGIDLDAADFIEYFASDQETGIIGAYIEGTRDGRHFLETVRRAAQAKPVVVWKGGATEAGARAAISHTGSMVTPGNVWSAVLKQAGVPELASFDEFCDTLLAFQDLGRFPGPNVAILTGIMGGGGGAAVAASDACYRAGLNVARLSPETSRGVGNVIGDVGSILSNPIDISQTRGRIPEIRTCIEILAADPNVDAFFIQEDVDVMLASRTWEDVSEVNDFICSLRGRLPKPIIMALPPGNTEPERLEVAKAFATCGIPVFPSMPRAAQAVANMGKYAGMHDTRSLPYRVPSGCGRD